MQPNQCVMFFITAFFVFLPGIAFSFDFSEWDVLLEKYVTPKTISGIQLNGVDYKNLKDDLSFTRLLIRLQNASLSELKTPKAKLTFWINVYNILAVKMVLDHYPIKSIKNAGGLFSPVWEKDAGIIGGTPRTLHEIEHEILRKTGDPRIHAAIVCASVSCPDLRREAFVENKIENQLDEQIKTFLANPSKGMKIEGNRIYLSKIFKWFEEDFEEKGGVLKFLVLFVSDRNREKIASGKLEVRHLNYNWSLNGH